MYTSYMVPLSACIIQPRLPPALDRTRYLHQSTVRQHTPNFLHQNKSTRTHTKHTKHTEARSTQTTRSPRFALEGQSNEKSGRRLAGVVTGVCENIKKTRTPCVRSPAGKPKTALERLRQSHPLSNAPAGDNRRRARPRGGLHGPPVPPRDTVVGGLHPFHRGRPRPRGRAARRSRGRKNAFERHELPDLGPFRRRQGVHAVFAWRGGGGIELTKCGTARGAGGCGGGRCMSYRAASTLPHKITTSFA